MRATLILAALSCGLCWGQAPTDCKPNPLNVPEAKYPCIFPDNRVMYRVIAPNAQSVRVGSLNLTKGPDNIWSGTTAQPAVEGFHYYGINIDGATVADPSTRTYFGSGWWNSGIEIPAPDQEFYQPRKNIPRGRVSEQWYFSTVTGQVAPLLRVHAAGLRRRKEQIPGVLPAARLGRRRDRLVQPGPRRLHHGQSDRGQEGEADDHRHGQPERGQAR